MYAAECSGAENPSFAWKKKMSKNKKITIIQGSFVSKSEQAQLAMVYDAEGSRSPNPRLLWKIRPAKRRQFTNKPGIYITQIDQKFSVQHTFKINKDKFNVSFSNIISLFFETPFHIFCIAVQYLEQQPQTCQKNVRNCYTFFIMIKICFTMLKLDFQAQILII